MILNIIKNNNSIIENCIDKIIVNLPIDYINKIMRKNIENIEKKIDKLKYKDYNNINNNKN